MMRSSLVYLLAFCLSALCKRQFTLFCKSLCDPRQAQQIVLKKILSDLAQTEYGKKNGIQGNENYREFAHKLPIQSYEAMAPWILRQLAENRPIITPHKVIHKEPTSGSSGPKKLIPYTRPLMKAFLHMFQIWVYDILTHVYRPKTGHLFMSISPTLTVEGFTDDTGYLNFPLRLLTSPFIIAPVAYYESDFIKTLALTLLKEENLEVISIWSPTYLLTVLDYISENKSALIETLPPLRAAILASALIDWQKVWPHLKLISCWKSGLTRDAAQEVERLFPAIIIQGKGLLATEAPITVPLSAAQASAPLINHVFFEFETENGEIIPLDELSDKGIYKLIISQQGGLTRYRLGDIVQVQGFLQQTPCLVFLGRDKTCDMVGEKLTEDFIKEHVKPLFPHIKFIIVPWQEGHKQGYRLLIDGTLAEGLSDTIDEILCQAHQYGLARQLGQLEPLQVQQIPYLIKSIREYYQCRGTKLGDIKEVLLVSNLNQSREMQSYFNGACENT